MFISNIFVVVFYTIASTSAIPIATSYSFRRDGDSGYSFGYGYNRVARSNYDSPFSFGSYSNYVVHETYPSYQFGKRYSDNYDVPQYETFYNDPQESTFYGKYFEENQPDYWKYFNDDYYGNDVYNGYNDEYEIDPRNNFQYPENFGSRNVYDNGNNDYNSW
ncbi:hypothetical protein JTB14_003090 [Gonioctena quinquepunctata]|nr:hypothetical protein JTB14_003090 [Gonioctena quinquepunctata]